MRIGINAVMLDGPRSGATRRIECLSQELVKLGHEVVLYRGSGSQDESARLPIPWRPSIARACAERMRLPSRIEADRLDAIEWSHLPLSIPATANGPKILLTIHDLRHLTLAQHSPFSRRFFARSVLAAAIGKAHRVIAVSEFTRQEIAQHLRVPPEKIVVVPNGADHMSPPSPMPAREEAVLFVGHLEPRKNLGVLLEAFALLSQKGFPHRLRIAGAGKGDYEEKLRAQAAQLGIAARIDWLGAVSEEILPALYAAAQIFVFPSLYEGFGIPVLEAMRCGTPVIASRAGALPEVGADACLYADPAQPSAWADAMESLIRDPRKREEMTARGLERANHCSWGRSAQLLAEAASS